MSMPISGYSNLTPNYTKETEQEQMKKGSSTPSSRAILAKDFLEVPFEKQISAHSQEAEPGRPFLPPLIRMRFVEDRKGDELSRQYYQSLRNELSPLLKEKLSKDEALRDLADHNPDLVALDTSLKFEANLLALAALAAAPISEEEMKLLDSQQNLELPVEMQQELITSGSLVLLRTFQTALYAQGTEQSQTGFMGPAILQVQQWMGRLIQASLRPNERELAPLLMTMTQLIAMGAIFIATQLVENWKSLFPQDEDPIAAEKAGWLLREMGLNFLLGSKAAESAFCSVGKGMGLKDESKKKTTDIGMCFLLTSLFLLHEDDSSQEESFLDTVKHFLEPTLSSIEQAIQEAEKDQIFEKKQASLAMNQIQMVHQALNKGNREELKQALSTSFDMLGMSLQEVKRDIRRISAFCAQLNKNFKNIFDQSPMTATTIQAA